MTLGEKIDSLLKAAGITKIELAKKLNLADSSVISHWVKNRFKPNRENLEKLAKEFKVGVSFLEDDRSPAEILAQKHNLFYSHINKPEGGVRDAGVQYLQDAAEYIAPPSGAKHIIIKEPVHDSMFELALYSSEGYLPLLLETFDEQKPFAIKIASSKVYGGATEGEYAVIRPLSKISRGKTALVKIGDKFCIRQVYFEKGYMILKDGKRSARVKTGAAEIAGQVIAFVRLMK